MSVVFVLCLLFWQLFCLTLQVYSLVKLRRLGKEVVQNIEHARLLDEQSAWRMAAREKVISSLYWTPVQVLALQDEQLEALERLLGKNDGA